MPHTPFQARLVRVHNVGEAKTFLTDALARGSHDDLVGGDYPFDLDLAGMLFPLNNRGIRPDEPDAGGLSPAQLGEVFADAAWELCLLGTLRPGPRSPLDKTVRQSSGYCLTERGRRDMLGGGKG